MISKYMNSSNKDVKLIWEAYTTNNEGIEDDYMDFADENPSNKPQPSKSSSLKLNRPPEKKELDDYGREYVYRGPKDGAFDSEQQMRQALEQLPVGLDKLFRPSREGPFFVLEPSVEFKSYGSDGDGMGGVIEHDMGDVIVGLADGNFLEYIKFPKPEEEDTDADLFSQSENDYRRGEGLPERDDR